MAIRTRDASGGVPQGNSSLGQSATPPGDTVTSQLPAKVYTGNYKLIAPPQKAALILTDSSFPGYFSSPAVYVGARPPALNPASKNADPVKGYQGGAGNVGVLGKKTSIGTAKKAKASAKKSYETLAAVQERKGRASTALTSKYTKTTNKNKKALANAKSKPRFRVPRRLEASRQTLGTGSVVRLPRK
jgi:hypothetical protein